MRAINKSASDFGMMCWYQPVYVWPCLYMFPAFPMPEVGNPPVLTQYNRTDYGSMPFTINIEEATKQNQTYRTALWTGNHLQLTLMSIAPGEDIGLEIHPHTDQFIRLEEGQGLVQMGPTKNQLYFERQVSGDDVILIPAGTWHNLTNTGNGPIKLYSIYAPPNHPHSTVHDTKAIAEAAEKQYE